MGKKTQNTNKFENAMSELTDIVQVLESGEKSLDEMVMLYEKAKQLEKTCRKCLEEAKMKITIFWVWEKKNCL